MNRQEMSNLRFNRQEMNNLRLNRQEWMNRQEMSNSRMSKQEKKPNEKSSRAGAGCRAVAAVSEAQAGHHSMTHVHCRRCQDRHVERPQRPLQMSHVAAPLRAVPFRRCVCRWRMLLGPQTRQHRQVQPAVSAAQTAPNGEAIASGSAHEPCTRIKAGTG